MNETQAPVKFLSWMLAVGIAFGLIGSLKKVTYKMAEMAIEAHQKDQMSYGKFSRQLWTVKKKKK